MRDAAYAASVELAQRARRVPAVQRRPLPVAAAASPRACPTAIKDAIRTHGIRNSHLLSIAPTGTISLAFADNASQRHRAAVLAGPTRARSAWPTARSRSSASRTTPGACTATCTATRRSCRRPSSPRSRSRADAHQAMVAAVAPFIDTSISKTVNVPEDYPYADFEDLYLDAWKSGLKGLATYRPNAVLGSVLTPDAAAPKRRPDLARRRRQPPPRDQGAAAAGAREPALAGPPRAPRRQPRRGPT